MTTSFRPFVGWFLLAALLSHATFAQSESDTEIRMRLVGQWQEQRSVPCEEYKQRIHLHKDGTFKVNGTIVACDGTTPFVWQGTWHIKNGKFSYITTYSNVPTQFPIGESFEDQVISVTDREWIMIEQSTGKKSIATRVK